MDIFLNQLIQFYLNNVTNLQHLSTHSMMRRPTKWQSHCDHRYVTSLHHMYNHCRVGGRMTQNIEKNFNFCGKKTPYRQCWNYKNANGGGCIRERSPSVNNLYPRSHFTSSTFTIYRCCWLMYTCAGSSLLKANSLKANNYHKANTSKFTYTWQYDLLY